MLVGIHADMFKIGNLLFGTKAELIESLFKPVEGRTLDGVYKKRKYGIALNRANGEPWMFIFKGVLNARNTQ